MRVSCDIVINNILCIDFLMSKKKGSIRINYQKGIAVEQFEHTHLEELLVWMKYLFYDTAGSFMAVRVDTKSGLPNKVLCIYPYKSYRCRRGPRDGNGGA